MTAFIDEYGDTNLDIGKKGVTQFYILCAIVVDENEKAIESRVDLLAEKHFSGSEIKSSKIGNDTKRRIALLADMASIPYYAIAIIIDKSLLYSEGLAFKKSFFKFLNGRMFQLLFENYPGIIIKHDEYGSDSFMNEFEKYINKKYEGDLFEPLQNSFISSHNSRLIQLADLLAGSLAKAIDTTIDKHKNIATLLTNEKLYIEHWPLRKKKEVIGSKNKEEDIDDIIEQISYNMAIDFIETNKESSDEKTRLQVYFLKYLLNVFDYVSKNKYTYANEISENLSRFKKKISNYYIKANIVAPLRDNAIPIASSSHGYKIPCKKRDVMDYIKHTNGVIQPMQNRLRLLWKKYHLLSMGKINLKEGFGFPKGLIEDE